MLDTLYRDCRFLLPQVMWDRKPQYIYGEYGLYDFTVSMQGSRAQVSVRYAGSHKVRGVVTHTTRMGTADGYDIEDAYGALRDEWPDNGLPEPNACWHLLTELADLQDPNQATVNEVIDNWILHQG